MKKRVVILAILCLTACSRYIVHPGSVNTFDSQTYDALIGAKAVIDSAREQFKSGALPPNLVPLVDRISLTYNAAYPAWKTWRDAVQNNKPAEQYLAALNRDMTELSLALANFRKGGK